VAAVANASTGAITKECRDDSRRLATTRDTLHPTHRRGGQQVFQLHQSQVRLIPNALHDARVLHGVVHLRGVTWRRTRASETASDLASIVGPWPELLCNLLCFDRLGCMHVSWGSQELMSIPRLFKRPRDDLMNHKRTSLRSQILTIPECNCINYRTSGVAGHYRGPM